MATTRTSPEVDEQLLTDLKTAVRAFNDGKMKGRLSPTFESAMQLYLAVAYARNPMKLKRIEEETDVDNPDEYRTRMLACMEEVGESIQEAADMLEADTETGNSHVEKLVSEAETAGSQTPPNQVTTSLAALSDQAETGAQIDEVAVDYLAEKVAEKFSEQQNRSGEDPLRTSDEGVSQMTEDRHQHNR